MKRIAVLGRGQETAAAKLIGAMLSGSTPWRVGVADSGETPPEAWSRLEKSGCDWAVAPVQKPEELCGAQVGVVTGLREQPGSALSRCPRLVLNLDDPGCRKVAEEKNFSGLTYSERRDSADLTAKALRLYPNRTEFVALTWDQIHRVRLPLFGGYGVYQGLAALGCGLSLGLRLEELTPGMEEAAPAPGCLEPLALDAPFQVILDRSTAPMALEGLLLALRPLAGRKGRLLTLSPEEPEALALCRELSDEAIPAPPEDLNRRKAALTALLRLARPGDVLAVTGCHEPGAPGDERVLLRAIERKQK